MLGIVFVPGIMGSRLALNGVEIWPPTVLEAVTGYRRIAQLANPAAASTAVIDRVSCKPVYDRVLADLAFIASGGAGSPPGVFVPFHYDWRKDLRDAAAALADHVDDLRANGAETVRIVAHSMGGLVARLYLESGRFDARPGWAAVTGLLTVATPHRGSPVAVGRALGLEATVGLSGPDTRDLARNPAFPALCQLFPGTDVVSAWNRTRRDMTAADIHDPRVAAGLGLSADNLRAARDVRAVLDPGRRPGHVLYRCIAATGHRTASRVDLRNGRPDELIKDDNSGDGAVPLWSAVLANVPHQYARGEHNGVLGERRFREQLYDWFGANLPIEAFADAADGRAAMSVSVDQLGYAPGEPMDVLLLPARPTDRVAVELIAERWDDVRVATAVALGQLDWTGAGARELGVGLDAPVRPGAYVLSVQGTTHASVDESDRAVFVVREA